MKPRPLFLLSCLLLASAPTLVDAASVTGELKTWHKVTLDFTGPETSETDAYNPFTHYRLNLTFHHPATDRTYHVPGYFAADGNAGETSAVSGSVWRAHFAPDAPGEWTWSAQFRKGRFVAASSMLLAGEPGGFMDGKTGAFTIAPSDKTGRDFRAHGRLQHDGGHYLRFAGSGVYFLKQGPDAPENFLSYADFDGTFRNDGFKDNLVKTWAAHLRDWQSGNPTWKDGKGKAIIGALNYIAGKGLNSVSMLTMNIAGDDQNVFPFTDYHTHDRYDLSKLDQWEIVFSHAQRLGLFLHFKTTEMESQGVLDHGAVGLKTMVYYREMVARFGHHLALNWNLGEENGEWVTNHPTPPMNTAQRHAMVAWFRNNDPYQHPVVIHNGLPFTDLLGPEVGLTGASIQIDSNSCNAVVQHWRTLSVATGRPWIIANDEQGPANFALPPDDVDPDHDLSRQGSLWGALLGGAWGNEWYFGYKYPHSDLTCQDWRTRDKFWDQARHALDFFGKNRIPFWRMNPANELLSHRDGYCLARPGETYVVFLKSGGTKTILNLGSAGGLYTGLGKERFRGTYQIRWFDPRNGGDLRNGSITTVTNTGDSGDDADGANNNSSRQFLGQPPSDPDRDWVVLVRKQP